MKTSFGELEVLRRAVGEELIVYMKFESGGRSHSHSHFETFYVVKGEGAVHINGRSLRVKAGDLLTVPPEAFHYMEPSAGRILEGFIWYHLEPLNIIERFSDDKEGVCL